MHHGSVEAHSAGLDRGSECLIRLPLADGRPTETAEPEGAGRPPVGAPAPRRILVVDDNQDQAQSMGLLLELMGHEVRLAHDGPGALEAAAAFTPDVAIVDIGLPGLNGYEVARRIREQPRFRGMVLVAQTGWGQAEDRRRSEEAGFDHHLVKPVDIAALQEIVASAKPPTPGDAGPNASPDSRSQ
jgi:CheY-like chemotaxis protein